MLDILNSGDDFLSVYYPVPVSTTELTVISANLRNRYSALCWRPVTHAQTCASYSALYRFGRLSVISHWSAAVSCRI